jgi:hypothetical protein
MDSIFRRINFTNASAHHFKLFEIARPRRKKMVGVQKPFPLIITHQSQMWKTKQKTPKQKAGEEQRKAEQKAAEEQPGGRQSKSRE